MSNVVSIHCTLDYLLAKAERHRCSGRFDEATALLWKARNQFGLHEEIEWAFAQVYEEIGCDAQAACAYLRIVRLEGKLAAQALFNLSLSAAQRGDYAHAISYFEHFMQCRDRAGISSEMAVLLGRQLLHETGKPQAKNKRSRAKALATRAAARLQEGKPAAAQYLMQHALKLNPSAQGYTMLACCHLLCNRVQDALYAAKTANRLSPSNVQTLCVLSDTYAAIGNKTAAGRALHLAAYLAKKPDDLLCVAVESAKHGSDALTLSLTKRLLSRETYHTRAMLLHACALVNLGQIKEANRIFGRLCGLMPENTICESYYRQTEQEQAVRERLLLGTDVTREEGIRRASELVSMLCMEPQQIADDAAQLDRACRLSVWAFHSSLAGVQIKTAALMLLSSIPSDDAQEPLLDALTDMELPDSLKLHILQVLTGKNGFKPYYADIGGKLVRLAAGGVSSQPVRSNEANSSVVQRASDALAGQVHGAAQMMLDVYLKYLEMYGQPESRHESACVAALEAFCLTKNRENTSIRRIARKNGVSVRLLRVFLRRLMRCDAQAAMKQEQHDTHEY